MESLTFNQSWATQVGGPYEVGFSGQVVRIQVTERGFDGTIGYIRFSFVDEKGEWVRRCSGKVFPSDNCVTFVEGWNWSASDLNTLLHAAEAATAVA